MSLLVNGLQLIRLCNTQLWTSFPSLKFLKPYKALKTLKIARSFHQNPFSSNANKQTQCLLNKTTLHIPGNHCVPPHSSINLRSFPKESGSPQQAATIAFFETKSTTLPYPLNTPHRHKNTPTWNTYQLTSSLQTHTSHWQFRHTTMQLPPITHHL